MATYVRLVYNGKVQTVALFEGLDTEELTSLLKTVFSIDGTIVGFMAEKGLLIPISLVSRSPNVVPNSLCKLLVADEKKSAANNEKATLRQAVVSSINQESSELVAEDSSAVSEEDDSTEIVTQEISEFIEGLRIRNFLSDLQASLLNKLLESNSTLLFAAYSVAISANDSEYFAEICKDLAKSLFTAQGRAACEAQDEVLQVSDQLYINNRISENQLLYLRHLVLIREEAVAVVYDQFQETQSVPMLAKSLYELCNTHPYQHARAASGNGNATNNLPTTTKNNSNSQDRKTTSSTNRNWTQRVETRCSNDEEDDVDDDEQNARTTTATKSSNTTTSTQSTITGRQQRPMTANMQKNLAGVVQLMLRAKILNDVEASVLREMIEGQNDYVVAAHECYESDRNLEDLQDTLLRCAKLEIRKQALSRREEQLQESYERSVQQFDADSNNNEDDDDEEEEEEEENEVDDEEEDEEDDDDDKEKAYNEFTLEDISLDSILESLGVTNIWSDTVPDRFVKTAFIAVIRKQMTVSQCKAVCDLYHAQYDLVRAAWEVFTVQEDTVDFIDTLRRIVKDMTLDSDKEGDDAGCGDDDDEEEYSVQYSSNKQAAATATATKSSKATTTSPTSRATTSTTTAQKASSASATAASTSTANTVSTASEAAASALERKEEALAAVAAAKRELLKHSLEMMVKQGITTGEAAGNLYKRYLQEDLLAEAAIDAYASDRNVAEFLDTLQILANHSAEELASMMKEANKGSSNDDDDDENSVDGKNNKKENVRSPTTETARNTARNTSATTSSSNSNNNMGTNSRMVQLQLNGIITELARNDMISSDVKAVLSRMVATQDRRLLLAYERYEQTQEGAILIDTMLRLASNELVGAGRTAGGSSSSSTSTTSSGGPAESSEPVDEDDEEEEEEDQSDSNGEQSDGNEDDADAEENQRNSALLNPTDQKTVIGILARAHAISASQSSQLCALIDGGSEAVRKIFQKYEADKDVYGLIGGLSDLNNRRSHQQDSSAQRQQDKDEDDDEEEEEEEEEGVFDEDDSSSVEMRFLEIVQQMQLSNLETAALRLAIARDDSAVRSAIDGFRSSLDESQLMSALRRISQQTIDSTLAENGYDGLDEHQAEEEEEEEEEEDDDDEEESDGDEEDDDADDEETPLPGNNNSTGRSSNSNNERKSSEDSHHHHMNSSSGYNKDSPLKRDSSSPLSRHTPSTSSYPQQHAHYSPSTGGVYRSSSSPDSTSHSIATASYSKGFGGTVGESSEEKRKMYEYKMNDDDDDEEEDGEEEDNEENDDDDDDDDDDTANSDDEEDDDEDEDGSTGGTSLITSQAARNHVFPILISELVKESIITNKHGAMIMKQFTEGSPVISAAIDVYDRDSDLSQLVQTLQQTVDTLH